MPVKLRVAKERRPLFSAEALVLFVELERMPRHSRDSQEFKDKSKRLAGLLGLTSEWWTINHVHDRSRAPRHPPWCVAYTDWHRVRRVREALLAAGAEARVN
jgi:hypothetical protein